MCSGTGNRLSDIVKKIAGMMEVEIDTVVNPEFVRLNDNHIIVGSHEKITRDIGWKPEISLETTLRDMIDYYKGL